MLNIADISKNPGTMLVYGAHRPNIQSVLDFDFMSGKAAASIVGIVTGSGRYQKYFWGKREILIPCYPTTAAAKAALAHVDWMFNMQSGRRAHQGAKEFFEAFPDAKGGHIFAEDVPEIHALDLYRHYGADKAIIGPAGVGLLIPGAIKLGVIGGVDWRQLQSNRLTSPGGVAVLSASGGMVNEIITMTARQEHGISFSLCFGGDRFPITRPQDAFLAAEADPQTEAIVYYGELGGEDEYELAALLQNKQVTKPVVCYIAGLVGEGFKESMQFGHAKALASRPSETASAKRQALRDAGATVVNSMAELADCIAALPRKTAQSITKVDLTSRNESLFSSTISSEREEGYAFGGSLLQDWVTEGSIARQIATGLLGHRPKSEITTRFIETVFLLSVDHGPQVSGAVATNITARAGKDMSTAVAAGLLTVGPRFGGAVSAAAKEWADGVRLQCVPQERIEECARAKQYISGIGHKKYRLDMPDPRVKILARFADDLSIHPHYDYARAIEAITTQKKGSLILNVDGAIAAIMLDILATEEQCSQVEIAELIEMDFFNALFIIPRVVGLASHYLDQRRLDEGLFRLSDSDVLYTD